MSYLVTTVHSKRGIPTKLVFQIHGAPLPFSSVEMSKAIKSMSSEVNGYCVNIPEQTHTTDEAMGEVRWASCFELVERIWTQSQSGHMPSSWSARIVHFIMKSTRAARDEMSLLI